MGVIRNKVFVRSGCDQIEICTGKELQEAFFFAMGHAADNARVTRMRARVEFEKADI
jgi:hypothetical protein